MGILEQIKEMKNKGIPEEEIVTKLQEQRVPPKKINDALEQSKIKEAVSDEEQMQPSIMQAPSPAGEETYIPKAQETSEGEYSPQQEYTPQQEDQYYPQEEYADYSTVTSTETMVEVAEQVFLEKIKNLQKKLEDINEFKTLAEVKINDLSERLKRMETIIDNLQISILDKVGNYGKNLDNIKKEMDMMQDTFQRAPKQVKKTSKN